ncbi:MAG TPA: type II toxin-antitoxin system MqsR family toxin [Stellaceae bacterium]|jgi:hypothetical protein
MSDVGPSYAPKLVKQLASGSATFEMTQAALDDALGFGLDDEDVREIFQHIDEFNFLKSEPTRHKYPGTQSDYYLHYVEECRTRMFIKFVIHQGVLIVTSFKEDDYGN